MRIRQVCSRKVVTVERTMSLVEAAKCMRDRHVGDLVVVEHRGDEMIPVGILTDRDIVVSVIARDIDRFKTLLVGDVMAPELVTARDDESLVDVLERMGAFGVRRVPVVNTDGVLVGILTLDDILCLTASQMRDMAVIICSEQYREREDRT